MLYLGNIVVQSWQTFVGQSPGPEATLSLKDDCWSFFFKVNNLFCIVVIHSPEGSKET